MLGPWIKADWHDFSTIWTKNFQMYKVGFKGAEEPEIKLPAFVGSWRKQGSSRKTSTFASLTMLKLLTVLITTNWNILKEMVVPNHLTCLLSNLYAGQEETVRTWLVPNWKGVHEGCLLSPCLFNFYTEYIMWNAGPDESQTGIKITGRNINNLRSVDDTTLMAESEELKNLLMRVKEERERAGLKFNIISWHPIPLLHCK